MHNIPGIFLWMVFAIPVGFSQGQLEKLPPSINTDRYDESSPVISKDGTRLFFTRTASPDFDPSLMDESGQVTSNKDDVQFHQRLSGIYSQISGKTVADPFSSSYNQDIWLATISDDTITTIFHPGYPLNSALTNSLVSTGMNPEEYVVINQFFEDGSMYSGFSRVNISDDGEHSFPKPMYIYGFNVDSSDVNLTMTPSGHVLVLSMNRSDGKGANDLFVSFYVRENVWSAPINMGDVLNSEYQETTPHITPDKRFLYFASNRPGGKGGDDIYVSERLDYTWLNWSTPKLLEGEVNSSSDDSQPYFDPKNHYMYFTSKRDGSSDIFRMRLIPRPSLKKPVFIKGIIVDASTGQPTKSELFWGQQSAKDFMEYFNSYDGKFEAKLTEYEPYKFQLRKPGSIAQQILVDPRIIERQGKDTIDMVMYITPQKIEDMITSDTTADNYYKKNAGAIHRKASSDEDSIDLANKLFLYNIQFVKTKAIILSRSGQALENLLYMMKTHHTLEIMIEGHTDNVGDELALLDLSLQRATVVRDYLVSRGIDKNRIQIAGLGATHPITDNATEGDREKNRRVEIKVIKP